MNIIELARKAGFAMENSAAIQAAERFARLVIDDFVASVDVEPVARFRHKYIEPEGTCECVVWCDEDLGVNTPLYTAEQLAAVRHRALEEAARLCHDASIPPPDTTQSDAQWAAAVLAVQIRARKEASK